ncbi:hypothetical protein ACIQK5_13440 [Streptomyces virginiae]|uniref:hypothetical protein n=1 Tax=Streptomyces TaxID=1883 RepID=UPI00136BBBE3|nr:hypothetical protein [Streptomyces sp. SID1046]MYV79534.1 hypothetical protein [Streptomyces sp. SID1046]
MPEPTMFLPCEPCRRCVFHAWQLIDRDELGWRAEWECDTCAFGAPDTCGRDEGRGPAPGDVRAAVVAAEGTVLVDLRGGGVPALRAVRKVLGLPLAQLHAAVRDGYRATPVEAELIRRLITGWTAAGAAAPE